MYVVGVVVLMSSSTDQVSPMLCFELLIEGLRFIDLWMIDDRIGRVEADPIH